MARPDRGVAPGLKSTDGRQRRIAPINHAIRNAGAFDRPLSEALHWRGVRQLHHVDTVDRDRAGVLGSGRRTPPSLSPAARPRPMRSTSPAINRSSSSMATRWLQCCRGAQAPRSNVIAPQQQAVEPRCPRCGSPMVHRIARRGSERGRAFWGCSRYPTCTGHARPRRAFVTMLCLHVFAEPRNSKLLRVVAPIR
jgi:predicted RNA-binding Zn-ribbon protein involved in translation (DUF1610 family)